MPIPFSVLNNCSVSQVRSFSAAFGMRYSSYHSPKYWKRKGNYQIRDAILTFISSAHTGALLFLPWCNIPNGPSLTREIFMPPGGMRACNPNKRAAADQRLWPRGHWDGRGTTDNHESTIPCPLRMFHSPCVFQQILTIFRSAPLDGSCSLLTVFKGKFWCLVWKLHK